MKVYKYEKKRIYLVVEKMELTEDEITMFEEEIDKYGVSVIKIKEIAE